MRRDGSPHLADDWDLMLADRFGADPYVVRRHWPVSLVQRAMARIGAEAKHGKKG